MRRYYKIDPRIRYQNIDELISRPRIVRVTEFSEKALDNFEKDMEAAHATGQPVIPVIIDSYGGNAYGCLGFVAAIETARVPVATVLTSKAMSAGAIVFCFGTEGYRFMHPEAAMMIHDVGSMSFGKIEEIKADTRHLDDLNTRIYRRVSKHLGHDPDYISDLIKKHSHVDWFLTAKEAKKHNIANHLRVPFFDIEVALKISFN